jgi:hypothetical protein
LVSVLIHRVIFEIAIAIYFKDSVSLSNVITPHFNSLANAAK